MLQLMVTTDKRTMAWLKLKRDYVEGLGDSLDLGVYFTACSLRLLMRS